VKSGLPASGGGQCGPVFSQISQYIMAQSVERKTSDIVDTLSHSSIPNKTDRYHVSLNNLQEVPNVVGMGAKDAIYVLKKCGMEVEIQGTGTVKSQSIKPGEAIEKQQKIKIVLE
jgi:cell division protein FtsI (penicillin-binding protein 3)